MSKVANLLTGDSATFEAGTGIWTLSEFVRSSGLAHGGSFSLTDTVVTSGETDDAATPTGIAGFAVTPGALYQFSLFVGATGSAFFFPQLFVRYYDSSGTLIETLRRVNLVQRPGESWREFGFVSTAPATAARAAVEFQFRTSSNGSTGWADDVYFGVWSYGGLEAVTSPGQLGPSSGNATDQATLGFATGFTVSTTTVVGGIGIRYERLSSGIYDGPNSMASPTANGVTATNAPNYRAGIATLVTSGSGHTTSTVPWLAYADLNLYAELNQHGWTYWTFAAPVTLVSGVSYSIVSVEMPGLARTAGNNFAGAVSAPPAASGVMAPTNQQASCNTSGAFVNNVSGLAHNVRLMGPIPEPLIGAFALGGLV